MTRPKVTVPDPGTVCKACLLDNAVGDGHVLVVYCPHHQTGASMVLIDGKPNGLWQMYSPITAEQWADAILNGREIVATLIMQKQAAAGGNEPPGSHTEH